MNALGSYYLSFFPYILYALSALQLGSQHFSYYTEGHGVINESALSSVHHVIDFDSFLLETLNE